MSEDEKRALVIELFAQDGRKDALEALRTNEKKWSKELMEAGWVSFPSILLEKQQAIGLDAVDVNIILHLVS